MNASRIVSYLIGQPIYESVELKSNIDQGVLRKTKPVILACFPGQKSWVVQYVVSMSSLAISVVALDSDKVIGFYFLGNRQLLDGIDNEQLEPTENLEQYSNKKGVEGIALGILPEYRGQGIGNTLKDYPKKLGVDYIWGLQLRELQNLQHWLKRRRLVAQSENMVATLEDYRQHD